MRRQTRWIVSLSLPGALLASALAAAQNDGKGKPDAPTAPPPAPAPAPAPAVPPPPGVIVNGQEQLAQLTQRYRPYLRVEYHFLRTVCALTPEERIEIARDVERSYKGAMVRYHSRRPYEQVTVLPDPRRLILEALARVAEAHLTPARADRYRQEIQQRAEDRKHAIIAGIVLKLDQALILSREQQAQLAARLGSGWDEAWFPTEHMMMNPEIYLSRVPSQLIVPMLSDDQKRVWELTFKQNNTGIVQGMPALAAGFPEDDELTRAREAEAKEDALTP